MSGSWPKPALGHLAEQHLGDRLSALIDGELGHDARDRVLAHLATCAKCRAEADAQRRLKNVFAEAAPPPPSESFLARLQGLPGGGSGEPGGGSPLGGAAFSDRLSGPGTGVFGVGREDRFEFGYVPARPHDPAADRGFRIHPVGRPDADRPASRGMRFAFVAAGAVSLAAVALGGVTAGLPGAAGTDARGGTGAESNMTPARTTGSGGAATPDAQRRRSAAPLLAQSTAFAATPAPPTLMSAPLLPGITGPFGQRQDVVNPPTAPGAAVTSPLIRPLSTPPPVILTSWPAATESATAGLLSAPATGTTSSP
ncbi:anti-sigma factor [Streptomyces sp. V3I7]|uniref:anti-sigma factor family protein n=1 Tax=Streptomyces sp. V3I7 TaxID=3042278 RepID=UPI0027828E3A|nr:zf-HC2 domain-containing protein [Streptomyces sp. V3I7]MDQ0992899.1 hypothetical protein [Streptomyces sp. V3I7]